MSSKPRSAWIAESRCQAATRGSVAGARERCAPSTARARTTGRRGARARLPARLPPQPRPRLDRRRRVYRPQRRRRGGAGAAVGMLIASVSGAKRPDCSGGRTRSSHATYARGSSTRDMSAASLKTRRDNHRRRRRRTASAARRPARRRGEIVGRGRRRAAELSAFAPRPPRPPSAAPPRPPAAGTTRSDCVAQVESAR